MSDVWSERLSEYLDGELAPDRRAALEAHLRDCPACRQELEALRRTTARLEAAPDREPEKDLWPEIHRALELEPRSEPSPASRHRWRAAIAAGLAVLAIGAVALRWGDRRADEMAAPGMASPGDMVAGYRMAVADWHRALEKAHWPPALDADLRAETEAFDRAVEETLKALRADPDDAELRAYLIDMLRAQLRYLSRVGPAAREVS